MKPLSAGKKGKRQALRDTADTATSEGWPSKEHDAALKNAKCEAEESEKDWEDSEASVDLPVISPLRAYGTSVFMLDNSDNSDSEEGIEQEDEEQEDDMSDGSDRSASINSDHGGSAQCSDTKGRRIGIDGRKYSSRDVYDTSDDEEDRRDEEETSGCNEGRSSGCGDGSSESESESEGDEASCDSLVRTKKLKIYGDDSSLEYVDKNDIDSDMMDDSQWSKRDGSTSEQCNDIAYGDEDLDLFRSRDMDDSDYCHGADNHSDTDSRKENIRSDRRDGARRGSSSSSGSGSRSSSEFLLETPHGYLHVEEEEDRHTAVPEEDQREETPFECQEGHSMLLKVIECELVKDCDSAKATDRSPERLTKMSDVTYGEESVLALAAAAAAVAASRAADPEVQGMDLSELSRGDDGDGEGGAVVDSSVAEGKSISEIGSSPDRFVCTSLAINCTEGVSEVVSLLHTPSSAPSPTAVSLQDGPLMAPASPIILEIAKDDCEMTEHDDIEMTDVFDHDIKLIEEGDDGDKMIVLGSEKLAIDDNDNDIVVSADVDLSMDNHSASILSTPPLPLTSADQSPQTIECPSGEPSVELSSGDVRCKNWIEKVIRSNIERRFSVPYVTEDEQVEEGEYTGVRQGTEVIEAGECSEVANGTKNVEEEEYIKVEKGEPVVVETEGEEKGKGEGEGAFLTYVVGAADAASVSSAVQIIIRPETESAVSLGREVGFKAVAEMVPTATHLSATATVPATPFAEDVTMTQHQDDSVSTTDAAAATANIEAVLWTGTFTVLDDEPSDLQSTYPTAHPIIDSTICPSSSSGEGLGVGVGPEVQSESTGNPGPEFLEILEVVEEVEVADLLADEDALLSKDIFSDGSKGLRIVIEDTGYRIGNMGCPNPPSASFNPSSCSSKFQSPSSSSNILASYSGDLFSSFVKGRIPGLVLDIDAEEDEDDATSDPCADRRDSEGQLVPHRAPETPPPPPPAELTESPTTLSNRDTSTASFRRNERRNKLELSASTMPSSYCEENSLSPGRSLVRLLMSMSSFLL